MHLSLFTHSHCLLACVSVLVCVCCINIDWDDDGGGGGNAYSACEAHLQREVTNGADESRADKLNKLLSLDRGGVDACGPAPTSSARVQGEGRARTSEHTHTHTHLTRVERSGVAQTERLGAFLGSRTGSGHKPNLLLTLLRSAASGSF